MTDQSKYIVVTVDNFHYGEKLADVHGQFASAAEAIASAKTIVDEPLLFLLEHGYPSITATELYDTYMDLGDDSFIKAPLDATPVEFSV